MAGSLWELAGRLVDPSLWVTVLLSVAVKGGFVLLCSLPLVHFLRNKSAALRHLVLASGFAILLVLPALSLWMPTWQVSVLRESPVPDSGWAGFQWRPNVHALKSGQSLLQAQRIVSELPVAQGFSEKFIPKGDEERRVRAGDDLSGVSAGHIDAVESGSFLPPLSIFFSQWPVLLLVAWATGFSFLALRLLVGMACVRFAVLRSRPLNDEEWKDLARETAEQLQLRRKVQLLTHTGLEVALSVGIWHSVILLPKVSETWSVARKRSILLHELSHIRRWDNAVNLIAQWCCAFYWFNPLIWWASRKLLIERERACDDEVLSTGTRASDYATHLLEVARAISNRRFWAELEVSQSSALKNRVMAVLDPDRNRLSPTRRLKVVAAVIVACLVMPLSALQPWRDEVLDAFREAVSVDQMSATQAGLHRNSSISKLQSLNPAVNLKSAGIEGQRSEPRNAGIPARAGGRSYGVERNQQRPVAWSPPILVGGVPNGLAAGVQVQSLRDLTYDRDSFLRTDTSSDGVNQPSRRASYPILRSRPRSSSAIDDAGDFGSGPADNQPTFLTARISQIELGTLGGLESSAVDINDLGQIVGASHTTSGVVHPFLWSKDDGIVDLADSVELNTRASQINQNGQVLCETFNTHLFKGYVWSMDDGLVDVGALSDSLPLTIPNAMNDAGMVVGASRNDQGTLRAVVWHQDIGLYDIGAPGWSEALGVNARGQVVGYGNNDAFVWDPEDGLEIVSPPNSRFAIATAINENTHVVGYAENGDGVIEAFLWTRENGHVDLGSLGPEFPISLALGVNEAGVVVGQALSPPGESPIQVRAFLWTPESGMTDIGASVQFDGQGPVPETRLAINALGQVIGVYSDEYLNAEDQLAFIWTESGAIPLVVEESVEDSVEAVASNNRNQLVGSSIHPDKTRTAALWELTLEVTTKAPATPPE